MKLVRAIMIKLLWNICTCVYTYGLELFRLNIYLHVISTNFETGLPRYNLCIFRRGWNLSCYRSDPIIMKILSEQFVLKLCQIDNLCKSWGKLKLLLMKIILTFSGGQKLRIFGRSWNFLRSQFWNLEQFFWNFVRIIICKNSPLYLTFLHFIASDSVVTIQPGDTSNVEETSYFTAGFAFHKIFKSVARFVNAAIKQNPR